MHSATYIAQLVSCHSYGSLEGGCHCPAEIIKDTKDSEFYSLCSVHRFSIDDWEISKLKVEIFLIKLRFERFIPPILISKALCTKSEL